MLRSRAVISHAKRQPGFQVSQQMGSWPKAETKLPGNRFSQHKSRNPPQRLCERCGVPEAQCLRGHCGERR